MSTLEYVFCFKSEGRTGLSSGCTLKLMRPHFSKKACMRTIAHASPDKCLRQAIESKSEVSFVLMRQDDKSWVEWLTCGGNICLWIKSVEFDHKVAVLFISCRSFARIDTPKELGKRIPLYIGNRVNIKPICRLWWDGKRLGLHRGIIGALHIDVQGITKTPLFRRVFNLSNLFVKLLGQSLLF